jgi:hypothetical protein
VRTVNQQSQDASLFNPFTDALALTFDIYASADLIALPNASFTATFQIFDPHTHSAVANEVWVSRFLWGQWFWISKGNNWGTIADWSTPARWGLNWSRNSVFGCRGIIKASYVPTQPVGSGWTAVDALSVSAFKWFRLKEVFTL